MAFGDPPSCDICGEPSSVRIVIIVFEGDSPGDQYLCRVHAPRVPADVKAPQTAYYHVVSGGSPNTTK
jgi:hypothetical protein